MAGDDDERVGYKRPPKTSRFPKGQSGYTAEARALNKAKKAATAVEEPTRDLDDDEDLIPVPVGGKIQMLPFEEARYVSVKERAKAGELPAIVEFYRLDDQRKTKRTVGMSNKPVSTDYPYVYYWKYFEDIFSKMGIYRDVSVRTSHDTAKEYKILGHVVAYMLDRLPNIGFTPSVLQKLREMTTDANMLDAYFGPVEGDADELVQRWDVVGPVRPGDQARYRRVSYATGHPPPKTVREQPAEDPEDPRLAVTVNGRTKLMRECEIIAMQLKSWVLKASPTATRLYNKLEDRASANKERGRRKFPDISFYLYGRAEMELHYLGFPLIEHSGVARSVHKILKVPNHVLTYMFWHNSGLTYTVRELRGLQESVDDLDFLDTIYPPRNTLGLGPDDIVPRASEERAQPRENPCSEAPGGARQTESDPWARNAP